MQQNNHAIYRINQSLKIRKILIVLCIFILSFGFLAIIFFSFEGNKQAIKFIANKEKLKKTDKVMMGPKIRLEYEDGFYDIVAKKALQKEKDDAQLFDVQASGPKGNVTAGSLLITNNGNDLYFSDNPVLIIKEIQQ